MSSHILRVEKSRQPLHYASSNFSCVQPTFLVFNHRATCSVPLVRKPPPHLHLVGRQKKRGREGGRGGRRRDRARSGAMAGAAAAAASMAMVGFRRGALLLLLFVLLHHQRLQVAAVKPIPPRISSGEDDAHKPILQESIVSEVNSKPGAGWRAAMNPAFSNHTVAQFKRLLGVKPLPKGQARLLDVPVKKHPESQKLKLPKEFDARTAWSQCATIGRILGLFSLLCIVNIY
ncbi:hypothetical protein Taro_027694 [Colocasia esculenta]|uniref:Peptidase C1A propeptide domain-containing protein n=1 Tax=Colocasia esculenta TaxID=4460 RepID=A0A843VS72_COLES|nr:hypothetical protein [Colocasia esculenta]